MTDLPKPIPELAALQELARKWRQSWSEIKDECADELESLLAPIEKAQQRQMDLIRFARHFLYDEGLISDEEYAAIVQDNEGGKRVERLESYDERTSATCAHDAEVRGRALEEAGEVALRVIAARTEFCDEEGFELNGEFLVKEVVKAIRALKGSKP